MSTVPAQHSTPLADGRLRCDVCPRECALREGQRGLCFVRIRHGDAIVLTTYGRSSGFCVDPIEKKPLNHFLPGTAALSFGTAGCNLTCRFCQNWDISRSRRMDRLTDEASPEAVAEAAARLGCRSVAFTYNDPTVFHEYAVDTAAACRARGIRTVAVTAGYVKPSVREELYAEMDAANVDLKGIRESFYRKLASAHLEPVLDTLRYLKRETGVWLEITNLVIPGWNDNDADIMDLALWVVDVLGPDVPLHFTAFRPAHRMQDVPPTRPATLRRARRIAREAGVRHVYTGNIVDGEGSSTYCHGCGAALIGRLGYTLTAWNLNAEGRCRECGTPLAGRLEPTPGSWGSWRVPIRIGDSAAFSDRPGSDRSACSDDPATGRRERPPR